MEDRYRSKRLLHFTFLNNNNNNRLYNYYYWLISYQNQRDYNYWVIGLSCHRWVQWDKRHKMRDIPLLRKYLNLGTILKNCLFLIDINDSSFLFLIISYFLKKRRRSPATSFVILSGHNIWTLSTSEFLLSYPSLNMTLPLRIKLLTPS